ncbi:MAG TPA: polysaccharide deacetylase family protein [Bryobacteraceae bacterium]|nr:polysaccharide deacetylase family protein [Bryobacteraceae bacterium]
MKAISIGYHDIVDERQRPPNDGSRHSGRYKLDRGHFRAHLDSIRRNVDHASVRVIDRARQWHGLMPLYLTFDDGAASSYAIVAGELEERGWRGHFFVTTDWTGRPGFLDAQQIRELHARGHVIGSHSCSHPARMSKLSWAELLREWKGSCAILSHILQEPVLTASVADGYYSRKVGKAAAEAGIQVLFTSEPSARVSVVDGCLILGRYSIQSHTPADVSGAIAARNRWPRLRQAIVWQAKKPVKAIAGESYFAIRRLLLSRGLEPGAN